MRVALIHDWLTGLRGGEKVLEVLCELFPTAPIFTLLHVPRSVTPAIERHRIHSTFLSRLPFVRHYYRQLLPLFPALAGTMRVRHYDLVVAVSHCVAHGMGCAGSGRFVAYYLTPMRYAWFPETYQGNQKRGGLPQRLFPWIAPGLRRWDRRASRRPTEALAVSQCVQRRIAACYGRRAKVLYPPVDTEFYCPGGLLREEYYLWVGALAAYKRIDIALEAFGRLGKTLLVVGTGWQERWARRNAPSNVRFAGHLPDHELRQHYRRCRALVFPGEEDFGIVPVEAQACGCPVIAYGKGGALETVLDLRRHENPTGVLFFEQQAAALCRAITTFEQAAHRFDPRHLRAQALRFARARCKEAFRAALLGGGGAGSQRS